MWKRSTWHECAEELSRLSSEFRRAYWELCGQGSHRHPDDQSAVDSVSREAVRCLRSLALAVRSEQDFGLLPPGVATVGRLKASGAEAGDIEEAKGSHGLSGMQSASGYSPLGLREALNKIAHANPSTADFYIGRSDGSHDLLLMGKLGRNQWLAVISIPKLVQAVQSLPDDAIESEDDA